MSRTYLMIAFTNPVEGEEAEYNRWYTDRHVRDILTLDGVSAAQRFEFVEPLAPGTEPPRFRFLAMYEVEEENLETARAAFAEAARERAEALEAGREPRIPISPSMADDRVSYWFVERSDHLFSGE